MRHVRIDQVGKGQHPSEVTVAVRIADGGAEQLIVDRRSIHDDMLDVGYPVGEDKDRWLIKLPRESLRGIWRVWIPRNSLDETGLLDLPEESPFTVEQTLGDALPEE